MIPYLAIHKFLFKLLTLAAIVVGPICYGFNKSEQVIIHVAGSKVSKAEFDRMYNKNKDLDTTDVFRYAELYALFKMKVAEAREAGLDTLPSFINEMHRYQDELVSPLIADSSLIIKYAHEAWELEQIESELNIIFRHAVNADDIIREREFLDSLRREIVNGHITFAEAAHRYSQEEYSSSHGGKFGWISSGQVPYHIEKTSKKLAKDEISIVGQTPAGLFLIKGGRTRPSSGSVAVSMIVKVATPETQFLTRHALDSVYEILRKDPTTFQQVAANFSDDRTSAMKGGYIGYVRRGDFSPDLDSILFSLKDLEISEPYLGDGNNWFILQRMATVPNNPWEKEREKKIALVTSPQDPREALIRTERICRLSDKYPVSIDSSALERFHSEFQNQCAEAKLFSTDTICMVDKKVINSSSLANEIYQRKQDTPIDNHDIDTILQILIEDELLRLETNRIISENADIKELLREYEEGTLLYEISYRKLWDPSLFDTESMQQYFESNRDKYQWNKPHIKACLISAVSDSVRNIIIEDILTDQTLDPFIYITESHPGRARIRLISEELEHSNSWNLMDGRTDWQTPRPFQYPLLLSPRILETPEEASDMINDVKKDYQHYLQTLWEETLYAKYPYKINKKELKLFQPR